MFVALPGPRYPTQLGQTFALSSGLQYPALREPQTPPLFGTPRPSPSGLEPLAMLGPKLAGMFSGLQSSALLGLQPPAFISRHLPITPGLDYPALLGPKFTALGLLSPDTVSA